MQKITAFVFLLSIVRAFAQNGSNDTTFNTIDQGRGIDVGGWIYSITQLPNNNYVVAGRLSSVHDYLNRKIAIIKPDGSLDENFNSGTGMTGGNIVFTTAYRSDGKIIAGGQFTNYNGNSAKNLVLLNMDGSIDNTFNCATGANDEVKVVAAQSDNKILVGGYFTAYHGFSQGRITRLTQFGYIDNSFNSGSGFNGIVYDIKVLTDGKILVAGGFTTYNGQPCDRLVRLNSDGSIDPTFSTGGISASVTNISIASDGKIAIAGGFTSINGVSRTRIAQLNADGSLDLSFDCGTGYNVAIGDIDYQADGKIVVCNSTNSPGVIYNGVSVVRITRLNSDGTLDTSFSSGQIYHGYCLLVDTNQKIMLGGYFNGIGINPINNLVRLKGNGTVDHSFVMSGGASGNVRAIKYLDNGKILIGGGFLAYNGRYIQRSARLLPNGLMDTTFTNFYAHSNSSGSILAIEPMSNGQYYVGGDFFIMNGSQTQTFWKIMRCNADGTPDITFPLANNEFNTYGYVYALGKQSNDQLIVGGSFTHVSASVKNRIMRTTNAGTLDYSFQTGTGFNSTVQCLAVDQNDRIIVGGEFTSFNGNSVSRIVRLNANGSFDSSFQVGTGANGLVRAIDIHSDGKIIIVGDFDTINGIPRKRIAQLLQDGSVDLSFDPGISADSIISSLVIQPDGSVIIGGYFLNVQGVSNKRIAKLSTTGILDPTFNTGTGYEGNVLCMALQNDGKIITGGDFLTSQATRRTRINRLNDCYVNSSVDTQHACEPYTWIDGNTYATSNNSAQLHLQNISGCDSVVTLDLTVASPTDTIFSTIACSSYTIGDSTYTVSGMYHPILENANGCDSLVTLDLTILSPTSSYLSAESCASYTLNGETYTVSGTYTQVLSNSVNCDSTITLNLTVFPEPVIEESNGILSVTTAGTVQWVNCSDFSPISAAIATNFTPIENGSYAVIVDNGSCSDTSSCFTVNYIGITSLSTAELNIYPNPTSAEVVVNMISEKGQLTITDLYGKQLLQKEITSGQHISLSEAVAGIYVFELKTTQGTYLSKIVKN